MIDEYLNEILRVASVIAQDNERNILSCEDLLLAYKHIHQTHPNFYGAEESYFVEEKPLKQSDQGSKVEIPKQESEMSDAMSELSISENNGTYTHSCIYSL
jgi:hypothetical protein